MNATKNSERSITWSAWSWWTTKLSPIIINRWRDPAVRALDCNHSDAGFTCGRYISMQKHRQVDRVHVPLCPSFTCHMRRCTDAIHVLVYLYTTNTNQTCKRTAMIFSLMPPTGRTLPVSDTSPVIARFCRTGTPVANDNKAVTMVQPALGPSFGVAPCKQTT